jgi:hypothetical protein
MMTATFFFLMPMIYLSGFIFPIENMPAAIQPFTYLIPLRYFLVIVRGHLPEGHRAGTALAAGPCPRGMGRGRAGARRGPQPENDPRRGGLDSHRCSTDRLAEPPSRSPARGPAPRA